MKLWHLPLGLAFLATPAHAYIGPGAGLGAIFTLLAVVLGATLLLVGFVWFPLRRALRKNKGREGNTRETDPGQ